MAAAHAAWIAELFGEISDEEQRALWSRLGVLKASVLSAARHRRALGSA
jgi:hypothetical protein